nr:hypothetical protein L203_00657 [Cryptococcus depauperatus CBS 7841]
MDAPRQPTRPKHSQTKPSNNQTPDNTKDRQCPLLASHAAVVSEMDLSFIIHGFQHPTGHTGPPQDLSALYLAAVNIAILRISPSVSFNLQSTMDKPELNPWDEGSEFTRNTLNPSSELPREGTNVSSRHPGSQRRGSRRRPTTRQPKKDPTTRSTVNDGTAATSSNSAGLPVAHPLGIYSGQLSYLAARTEVNAAFELVAMRKKENRRLLGLSSATGDSPTSRPSGAPTHWNVSNVSGQTSQGNPEVPFYPSTGNTHNTSSGDQRPTGS